MPGPGAKPIKDNRASVPGWLGALTQAGRIAAEYASVRLDDFPAAAASAAEPTPARRRAARQQAAAGARFAREGRLAMAIERFRQAADLDPSSATLHHDLGVAYLTAGRLEEAVIAFCRAVDLAPELLSAHQNLAMTLHHLGRDQEAQAAWEAVVRLNPAQHEAHARLGQIYLSGGWVAQAAAAFRSAAAAAGGSRARIYEAHEAVIAGRPSAAKTLLHALIAEDPTCGEAHVLLGQIMAEAGDADEAVISFERGITLDPAMAAAWYQFSTVRKFTADDQALIVRIGACLQRPDLTQAQRQSIHFALGKAFDDIGDHAASMHHLDAANQIRSTHRRLDRTLLARQTSHVIASSPPGFLDRRPDLGVPDETPVLIVGMPRSGTTLVEQILSSHHAVAAGGELGFWRERNRAGLGIFAAEADAGEVRRLADDYLKELRAISPSAARVTDKLPFNFAHLGIIRQVFPRATIVHCRRHPIDTCLSNFATDIHIQYDFAGDRGSLVFFYRQYQRLMAHWRAVLPAERFIEVDYEVLVADPEPLTRRLVAACGLDWDEACLAPHRNRRAIGTASLWQARQPIYRTSVERWRRYEPWLGELRALLADGSDEPLAN